MADSDNRLIVALDLPDAETASKLVAAVGDAVGFYKIGLGMVARNGFELADNLKRRHGKRVFLDVKLFDIGTVVADAVAGLMRLEPDFLTVHGDPHVVRAAVRARRDRSTRILAVTILTSLDRGELDGSMIEPGEVGDIVAERARRAFLAGADGVICSAREAARVRRLGGAGAKLIVTPGIRPPGSGNDDQRRVSTPAQAIAAGVDHIVVGRPVTGAADPRAAALRIIRELSSAAGAH